MNIRRSSIFQKDPLRYLVFLIALIIAFCLETCKDNPVNQGSAGSAGISGTVYDPSGHPLDSVKVYCLYSFALSSETTSHRFHTEGAAKVDTFGFTLYQNFPNPFQNSTYLRFSIPVQCSVSISLTDRISGKVIYSTTGSFLDGMYQVYLENIVDSLQMHNGPYSYKFSATGNGGQTFSASKEVFVVSDLGKPNSLTATDGMYYFNYADAFVGDSVMTYTSDLYPSYATTLGGNVTLLFERRGYESYYSSAKVYPTIQFHSDIIMTRTNQ